jgi:hypothetical protein
MLPAVRVPPDGLPQADLPTGHAPLPLGRCVRLLRLQTGTGTPLLRVDRVSSTYESEPVEFRRGWCLTARHHYYNELG